MIQDFGKPWSFGRLHFDKQVSEPTDKFEFKLVNLEFFMIELAGIGHGMESLVKKEQLKGEDEFE